jgi:hypothetical protein
MDKVSEMPPAFESVKDRLLRQFPKERDYEKSSGAIYTEGMLVHELAHASSMYQGYVVAAVTADEKCNR